MRGFAERWLALRAARSAFCLGLDPSAELMADWGLADDAAGLAAFCDAVMDAAGESVSVVKPQAAFFERFGAAGVAVLARVIARCREQGSLSLLDAKRGDVDGTMEGYGEAALGAAHGLDADAVTLTAYLGFDALRPVFARAAAKGGAAFVVVRSSNPEGRALQDARLADGRMVADALADAITAWNAGTLGPVGAVFGATVDAVAAKTLERLPTALILAPGVGAQGATFADVAARFGAATGRSLPSVSRALLRAGPSVERLREAIEACRQAAWAMEAS
jgi:orotidine-5'-phosphate decarboxylase